MANQYRSVLASGGASTGGDALPAEVLAGKTFTNDNGAQTGTMPNRGAISQTIAAGSSYTIPEGYHNGSGTVTASSLNVSDLTFTTSDGYVQLTNVNIGDTICFVANASKSTISSVVGLTEIDSDSTSSPDSCVVLYKATATTVRVNSSDSSVRLFMFKLS